MKRTLLKLSVLLLILCLPLTAVAETAVASFYPIWLLANELTQGVDDVEVVSLAPQDTGCLHDYQLSTSDMKKLATADVLLINGAGMETFLPMVTGAFPELPLVDASVGIELMAEDDTVTAIGESEAEVNAHIWLDPKNAMQMVRNLSDGLSAIWPQHQAAFEANRDAFILRLEELDQELADKFSTLEQREIITFHEAFPYFAKAYGFEVPAVVNHEPGEAISPAQLASLILLVRELGAPPLFVEPQYDDLAAQTLSRETGAAVYTLDPIVTGPEGETPIGYYEQIMRKNCEVLLEALSSAAQE